MFYFSVYDLPYTCMTFFLAGYVMSTVSSNLTLILALAPLVMTPLMLFGGLFMNAGSVPVYFVWLQYISWFNYCNEILVVNQWRYVTNISELYFITTVTIHLHVVLVKLIWMYLN